MSKIYTIKCEYHDVDWTYTGKHYGCLIFDRNFKKTRKYQFDTTGCRDPNEVNMITIENGNMPSIPKDFPWHQFPNLEFLQILDSRMEMVTKEDLKGLEKLKILYLTNGNIKKLPGDLLDDMNNLEKVSFNDNRIEFIESRIIDKLMTLDFLNLSGNRNINLIFSADNRCNATLQQVKREILKSCQTAHVFEPGFLEERTEWFKNDNLKLIDENEELHLQIIQMKEKIARFEKKFRR